MVKKILYLVLLVCLGFSCTNSQKGENKEGEKREEINNKQENTIPMHSVLALSNKIEILLPPNFSKMSVEEMIKPKSVISIRLVNEIVRLKKYLL